MRANVNAILAIETVAWLAKVGQYELLLEEAQKRQSVL